MSQASAGRSISVEVVFAKAERQELVALQLAAGSTVADAIERSGLAGRFDDFEVDPSRVGIFSRKVTLDQVLRDGDRVEIYRPLIADPKEARRQRALLQEKDG
jgi:putative ubiquitin-RnfH superfamily antitoxin RatB of RatAB toxin-antitoxin module